MGVYANIHLSYEQSPIKMRSGARKGALCALWKLKPEILQAAKEDEIIELHVFAKVIADGRRVGNVFICRKNDSLIEEYARRWNASEDSVFIGHAIGYPEKAVAYFHSRARERSEGAVFSLDVSIGSM